MSVYDLKDHPDFKYRPGSIVIRVANYGGEDSGFGAGQVLDIQPNGQVAVWWADTEEGVTAACWPQDLYKVGLYNFTQSPCSLAVVHSLGCQREVPCFKVVFLCPAIRHLG